jgi:hypothetical protein
MQPETIHLPFEATAFRMAMGLQSAPPEAMIELDALWPEQIAARRALLAQRHADVFAALPGSEAASAAVLARLAALLPRRFPALFAVEEGRIHNRRTGESWSIERPERHPLEVAGRLVQEDLCLIGPDHRLTAALLCFPSRWRLADKIGKPLPQVHAPVPLYAETLARPVERFLAMVKPGRLALRFNWSITDDPALFQPAGHGRTEANTAVTAANAGEKLFLRVERQTLSRAADHVLFTIRVHQTPLARAIQTAEEAARLAGAVTALPDAMARYKSIPPVRAALLGWLSGDRSLS